jgi:hypothetical protein
MAGYIVDPNNAYSENVNEDMLRDSLENNVDGCDSFTGIGMKFETDLHKSKIHSSESCKLPQNDSAKNCRAVGKEKNPTTVEKKKAVKPVFKNMIELNKMNVKKGEAVNSYSKIHRKKRGKTAPIEKDENITCETSSLTNAAIELRKQLVMDGILTDKDESNMALEYCHSLTEREKYCLDSTRSKETNLSHFGQGYNLGEELGMSNGSYRNRPQLDNNYGFVGNNTNNSPFEDGEFSSACQLPPVRTFPTSVQSAPADIQAYLDLSYEKSIRSCSHHALKSGGDVNGDLNNSMTSLASHSTTYSGLYANAKQNLGTNYKPYTLGDYKRLKQQGKPGGLGPDTKSEEHQQKVLDII